MKKYYILMVVVLLVMSFINLDKHLSNDEVVVGDLEYITNTFNPSAVQEVHFAKITLNTFGYSEVVNVNVLSDYESKHKLNTNVTVRIRNGYFTGYRYYVKNKLVVDQN